MQRLKCLPLVAAALFLTACQQTVEPELTIQPFIPLDQMESDSRMADSAPLERRSDSDMSSYRDGSTTDSADTLASDASGDEVTPAGERSYIVKKGDTLFAIARSQYNDASKWRDIWNANLASVSNKDRLSIGQELVLP